MALFVRRSRRAKTANWIIPLYLTIFFVYAAIGKRNQKVAPSYTENEDFSIGRHLLSTSKNCTPAALDEFPPDFLTQHERVHGGVIVHVLISCYLLYALAILCDDFFVSSLECICEALKLPTDVAGATFMAAGTSAPELFTSVIGAFVTEGDIGVGTIVGSAVFNILAVVSVCGLLAGIVVSLDWWPLTRDSICYLLTVICLIVVITDQRIEWWEALLMIILFFCYILVMVFNRRLERCAIKVVTTCRPSKKGIESAYSEEKSPLLGDADNTKENQAENGEGDKTDLDNTKSNIEEEEEYTVWSMPSHNSCQQVFWVILWPLNFLFYITIPDCRKAKWRKWYMVTFLVSIAYIATLTYVIAWMVTIIGYTIGVPDSVMGLTFLAAGTSVPEAISSVLVCRQGYGNMAISNILGSNIFDILFCLGVPWLIKAAAFSKTKQVIINSAGIEYSAISLLSTVVFLYGAVILNKFKLDKKLGIACLIMYIIFLIVSNLFEMNVFGVVNLPSCIPDHY